MTPTVSLESLWNVRLHHLNSFGYYVSPKGAVVGAEAYAGVDFCFLRVEFVELCLKLRNDVLEIESCTLSQSLKFAKDKVILPFK